MLAHKVLDQVRLRTELGSGVVGHTIEFHGTVTSTMSLAHALAEQHSTRSGHVIVAEEQTSGKGRRGRTWTAPYGQALLVSVVLKPPMMPAPLTQVPMAAGLAVAEAICGAAPAVCDQVSLKWPNDVVLGQGASSAKVAGVLVESSFEQGEAVSVVIGIGINVNQAPSDLPYVAGHLPQPASIRSVLGDAVDRTELLILLCQQLERLLDPLAHPDAIIQQWRSHLSTLGQAIAVYVGPDTGEPFLTGTAVDVSQFGDLLVRDAAGEIHTFSAADVSVRPENR